VLDYIQILQMHFVNNLSSREIASSYGCSKSAVSDFLRRFTACSKLSYPISSETTNELLYGMLYAKKGGSNSFSSDYREIDCPAIYKALPKKGETLKHLWRKYDAVGCVITDNGSKKYPYSYRQYCKIFNDWCEERNVTSHIQRYPGQNCELDFAGMSLYLKNRLTGEETTKVTIFVATMSYSNYCYAEALVSCDIQHWISANNHAIRYFGGVTPIITNDNCKVAVISNRDWIDPVLNKDFKEWAIHNNTVLLPAKVNSPRWKPHVEGAVKIITEHILIDMKAMTFFTLDMMNEFLWERLNELNNGKLTGRDCSRWDLFTFDEEKLLLPLPPEEYQYLERKEVRVYQDFHIRFESCYYSIPKKFVKQKVEVRASSSTLKIYTLAGTPIWKWKRSHNQGHWSTNPDHLPHKYREYLQWSMPGFQQWAAHIGPNTRAVIDQQFMSVQFPAQAFRRCQGILSFAKRYSEKALESCCQEAVLRGSCSYTYVKNTIVTFFDKDEESTVVEPLRENNHEPQPVYKSKDSQFSLDALIKKQETGYVKKH